MMSIITDNLGPTPDGINRLEPAVLYSVDLHDAEGVHHGVHAELRFQDGVVPQVGRNGFQNEDVIRALIDRIQILNAQFPCRENSITITKLQEALFWQRERTENRQKRSVEGQHTA